MQAEKIYATLDDFDGLYLREESAELIQMGCNPFVPELGALDRAYAADAAIRTIFDRLESRGIHIPTAYYLSDDGEGPRQSYREILWDIHNAQFKLWSIMDAMLSEDLKDIDSVCCG